MPDKYTQLNSFRRLNAHPCGEEAFRQEFAKLRKLLINAEDGLIPGFGGGGELSIGEAPGSVKMWALGTGAIPAGWAIMDGIANAAPLGSGIDMRGKFVKGIATTPTGTPGGNSSYTPAGSLSGTDTFTTTAKAVPFTTSSSSYPFTPTVDAPDYGGYVTVDTTITWDETEIRTEVSDDASFGGGTGTITGVVQPNPGIGVVEVQSGSGASGVATSVHHHEFEWSDISHYHVIDKTSLAHTHTIAEASLNHSHTISNLGHTHTGTTDSHDHDVTVNASGFTFTGTPATIEPEYVELIFIERLNTVGEWFPESLADADASNGTLYYSTDAGKLVYKDSGGTVNNLY